MNNTGSFPLKQNIPNILWYNTMVTFRISAVEHCGQAVLQETHKARSKGLGFRGLGFRGLAFRGLGFRGLGFRGFGFRLKGIIGDYVNKLKAKLQDGGRAGKLGQCRAYMAELPTRKLQRLKPESQIPSPIPLVPAVFHEVSIRGPLSKVWSL